MKRTIPLPAQSAKPSAGLTRNRILKQLQKALGLDLLKMQEIFRLAGERMERESLSALLRDEEDPGYQPCREETLGLFLDGLIISKRGLRASASESAAPLPPQILDNNLILKKIRIALQLKDEDIRSLLALSGFSASLPELNALFRKKGHRNYKPCGDQLLRNLLKGLVIRKN